MPILREMLLSDHDMVAMAAADSLMGYVGSGFEAEGSSPEIGKLKELASRHGRLYEITYCEMIRRLEARTPD